MKQILIRCSGRILLNLNPNMTFMFTWYFWARHWRHYSDYKWSFLRGL